MYTIRESTLHCFVSAFFRVPRWLQFFLVFSRRLVPTHQVQLRLTTAEAFYRRFSIPIGTYRWPLAQAFSHKKV